MNKEKFLSELKRELNEKGVHGVDEILTEYEEHFSYKLEEGWTEEEIAKKLSSPSEIAAEYSENGESGKSAVKGQGLNVFGVTMMSIPAAAIYCLMAACVAVLAGLSLCALALGFCLIFNINVAGFMPAFPTYLPMLFLGIACLSMCVLSAIGAIYAFLYVGQWRRCYVRWCGNLCGGVKPSISKHPKISKKANGVMKLIVMISLIVFVAAFAIGYIVACAYAGSFEPWYVWNWFTK